MQNVDPFLVAETKCSPGSVLTEIPLDDTVIYLGELSTGVFLALDEVTSSGEIRSLEASDLRSKCSNMLRLLEKTQRNNIWMEEFCAKMIQEERRISSAFRRCAGFPDGFNTQADELRKQTLSLDNEAMQIELNMDFLRYSAATLGEEKRMLQKEADKYPNEEMLKEKRREIEKNCGVISVDIQKCSLEARRLRRERVIAAATRDDLRNQLNAFKEHLASLGNELDLLHPQSLELMQENAKFEKLLKDKKDILLNAEADVKRKFAERSALISTKEETELEAENLSHQCKKQNATIDRLRCQLDATKREYQELQAEEINLKEGMAKMELDLENMKQEKTCTRESTNQLIKRNDDATKTLRETNKKIKSLNEGINFLQRKKEDLERQLVLLTKLQSHNKSSERNLLIKQISQFTMKIMEQTSIAERDKEVIVELMKEEESLLCEIDNLKVEIANLQRLVTEKSHETSQRKGFLDQARQHHIHVLSDLKIQQFQLSNNVKVCSSLRTQLNNFMKLFEAINVERNECHIMINLAEQQRLELEGKIQFYSNELAIFQSALSNKHRKLDELTKHTETLQKAKINLRGDISKELKISTDLSMQRTRLTASMHHLNQLLRESKRTIEEIKRKVATAISARDTCKRTLDELGEQTHTAEMSLGDIEGDLESKREALAARDHELVVSKRHVKEERRLIDISRKRDLERQRLTSELWNINQELLKTQDWLKQLMRLAEDLNMDSGQRFRVFDGHDPNPEALKKKECELNRRIKSKNSIIYQQERVHSATTKLVAKLSTDVIKGNVGALEQAELISSKRRNYQLKEAELKALIAELRMKILNADNLKNTVEQLEITIKEAQTWEPSSDKPLEFMPGEWNVFKRGKCTQRRGPGKLEVNPSVRNPRYIPAPKASTTKLPLVSR